MHKVIASVLTLVLLALATNSVYEVQSFVSVSSQATVHFEPQSLNVSIDQIFTVDARIENVELLYGIDLQITWNTSYVTYINHTVPVPVETYPDGVLHDPVFWVKNNVDENASMPDSAPGTRFWLAVASMYPASTFSGSGCAFTMTFRSLNRTGVTMLTFTYIYLSDNKGAPIPYSAYGCTLEIVSIHDVAVESIVLPKAIVGQTFNLTFNVTVENQGNQTETFALTARANNTTVQTQNVSLFGAGSLIVQFIWNTTGFAKGNYTLSVIAEAVPGETDTTDNTLNSTSMIRVTIPGDLNGDFMVKPYDIALLIAAYGSDPYPPNQRPWNPNADINNDGKVGPYDLAVLIGHYGQHYP